MPTAPPSDSPTNENVSAPASSRTRAARSATVRSSVTGAPPCPGCSTVTTRRPSSAGSCGSHIAEVEPSDPHRTTVPLMPGRARGRGRRTHRPRRGSRPAPSVDAEPPRLGQRLVGDVRAHACNVHLEAVERASDRRGRAARRRERGRERVPLRVPGTGRALVLLHGALEQHARVRARMPRTGVARGSRSSGCACAASSTSAPPPASRHLRHLGLREQDDVAADLRGDAGGSGERARRARRAACGSVCHGSVGSRSPSSAAYRRSTSGPSFPSAASVPAAPPSCAGSSSAASRARASTTPTSQPAAL